MKITESILKYLFTGLLTLGVIISVGLLSFSGLLLIYPHLALAILAFFLSGCIEGEVYRQNIFKGLKEFKLLGKVGVHKFIIKALNKQASEASNRKQCTFLNEYYKQKQSVACFKNSKLEFTEEENQKLTADEKKERHETYKKDKKAAKKSLRIMQNFYIERVLLGPNKSEFNSTDYTNSLQPFINTTRKDLPGINRKIWLLRASLPVNIFASIGSGFVTASTTKAALAVLSLKFAFVISATALSALIWPLAIVAAIGYTWMIYHTVVDIIYNDTVSKWRKKLSWFKPCKGENNQWTESKIKYVLRVTAAVLLVGAAVGLAVFATLATAGTWWFAVKKGVLLVPHFVKAASYVRNVLVPAVGIAQLLFNIKNSLDTVKNPITKFSLPRPIQYIRRKWEKVTEKENWLQLINPFRIVSKIIFIPYKSLVFVGHLAATGFTSDRLARLNPIATATASSLSEGFQDMPYFTKENKKASQYKPQLKKDHPDHSNVPELALKVALSPLLFLSATWNCLSSQLNKGNAAKPVLSFGHALKQSFGIKNKTVRASTVAAPAAVSHQWLTQETAMRFAEEEARLDRSIFGRALAQQKKNALIAFKKQILHDLNPSEHTSAKPAPAVSGIFKTNRLPTFFRSKVTNTEKFVDEIISTLYKDNRVL